MSDGLGLRVSGLGFGLGWFLRVLDLGRVWGSGFGVLGGLGYRWVLVTKIRECRQLMLARV